MKINKKAYILILIIIILILYFGVINKDSTDIVEIKPKQKSSAIIVVAPVSGKFFFYKDLIQSITKINLQNSYSSLPDAKIVNKLDNGGESPEQILGRLNEYLKDFNICAVIAIGKDRISATRDFSRKSKVSSIIFTDKMSSSDDITSNEMTIPDYLSSLIEYKVHDNQDVNDLDKERVRKYLKDDFSTQLSDVYELVAHSIKQKGGNCSNNL
jgi:hypothetical protein